MSENSDDQPSKKPKIEEEDIKVDLGKRRRKDEKVHEAASSRIEVLTSSEGESYIELGKQKRVTVRKFKGTTLIDIREFYGETGSEKPGKKGISLSVEQWKKLRSAEDLIDGLLSQLE